MKKRKGSAIPMAPTSGLESPSSPLKKQDKYSATPWKPNEVPARRFNQFITQPLDATPSTYGKNFFGVECPTNRGKKILDENLSKDQAK